jgi:hypothetical protein
MQEDLTLSWILQIVLLSIRTSKFSSQLDLIPQFFFQLLFQPIQGPGLLFSSVIIFHRR